jgi:outer membrane receptor protein involved in Fe transport
LARGCALSVFALTIAAPVMAQDTTSAVRGTVLSDLGSPVSGATVTLVHTPSGTRATTSTSAEGTFEARGLRIGGPYEVKIEAQGFREQTITDVFLTIGDTFRLETQLVAEVGEMEAIVVSAAAIRSGGLITGSASQYTSDEVLGTVSSRRDIRDLIRKDPFASFIPGNGGISFGGTNTRFNRFSVDGVQLQDNFGLNNGGLPSSRGLISLDAIEQISVKSAPFDIAEGRFQGGAVNVVLKSGTNDYRASGFYTYGSDSLASNGGKGPSFLVAPDGPSAAGFSQFTFNNWGAGISGPIIKDKLFFSFNYEWLRETRPAATGPTGSGFPNEVAGVTQTVIDQVRNTFNTVYGPLTSNFNIGNTVTSTPETDRKLNAKVDWNITDDHRLSLTYIQHKNSIPVSAGGRISNSATNGRSITNAGRAFSLESSWYDLTEDTKAYTAQLNSQWSDNFSTEFRVNLRDYVRGQDSRLGLGLGEFVICLDPTTADAPGSTASRQCGGTALFIGPDESRQSNAFASKTYTYGGNAQLRMGDHLFKLIAEYQKNDINNLFIQRSRGQWYFDSIASFGARRAEDVRFTGAISGNIDDGAAIWGYDLFTVGLQDTWELTDTLTLQAGLRYDVFGTGRGAIPLNERFLNTYGFTNQATLKGRDILQPRFGFNWDAFDWLNVAGGIGLFSGGTPDVWVSNNYSNNGVVLNETRIQRTSATAFTDTIANANPVTGGTLARVLPAGLGDLVLNQVTGLIPTALQAYISGPATASRLPSGNLFTTGSTNALDPNFEIPSTWRYNLQFSFDLDLGALGDGWTVQAAMLGSEVKNTLSWTDLRARPLVVGGVNQLTPDGRQRFDTAVGAASDILLRNDTTGNSQTYSIAISKAWDFGLDMSIAYTRNRSRDNGMANAATAVSAYEVTAIDAQRPESSRSLFEVTNQGRFSVGFRREFFGDNETRLELSGEIRSGVPFSYTFNTGGAVNGRSPIFGLVGSTSRYPFFVPDFNQQATNTGAGGRPRIGNVEFNNQATLDAMRAIVQSSELSSFQGRIAPRNIGTGPSFKKMDVRVSQQIPFFWGKFTAYADIENFLNLLNKNWNSFRSFSDIQMTTVSCVAEGTNLCARFLYTGTPGAGATDPQTSLNQGQSLWQLRIGIRYDF